MRDYIRTDIEIQPWSEDMADFLSALLGDIGYESFTHNAPLLTAYTYKDSWDCEAANALIADFPAPGVTLKALTPWNKAATGTTNGKRTTSSRW